MKIALCQINPTIGDFEGNIRSILGNAEKARRNGARLAIFPELAITGYPPRDLLLRSDFIEEAVRSLEDLASRIRGVEVVVGCIEPNKTGVGKLLFNVAAFISGSKVAAIYRKCLLPTYDVFDENRYFEPSSRGLVIEVKRKRFGLSICEDAWNDVDFWPRPLYHTNPIENLIEDNADIIVNISASPYSRGKEQLRFRMMAHQAKKYSTPILHVNQVGGNDELIFGGNSLVIGRDGTLIERGKAFEEDFLIVDDEKLENGSPEMDEDGIVSVYRALNLGLKDYLTKCGFTQVVIGLSGGIDSAVTAAIARFAVGSGNVLAVTMPSRYSSVGSLRDSRELSRNLGIRLLEIPIDRIFQGYLDELSDVFKEIPEDVTEENIQARIRGNILMALSNKFGYLVLSTGNKSELATGYCTLYGDMSGGLAVLSDVPKTVVYDIAKHINSEYGAIIPDSIMQKVPSAELKPDQTDLDMLPSYEILDAILAAYIEGNKTASEIAKMGYDAELVGEILHMVNRNEYKRRQAPPGLKLSPQAFGTGWRMPIAQRFNPQ
ncbi:MAG: NAD+ synthase [Candidatus Glassbacteria bacterium]